MRMVSGALLTALILTVSGVSPASAQQADWQDKWYWGAQGGVLIFETPNTGGKEVAYSVGGHWYITGERSALYMGYDYIIFDDNTASQVTSAGVPQAVTFSRGRRFQALLYAIPVKTKTQVFIGGGLSINQITDAVLTGTTTEVSDPTKAFPVGSAGFNLGVGRVSVTAQYQFMPFASDFILSGEQHSFTGGLRIAFGGAHEVVTTGR